MKLFIRSIGCLALFFNASLLQAQVRGGALVEQVLSDARRALDNLDYRQAAERALSVLAAGSAAGRSARIEALMIAASALYPDEQPTQQRPDSASQLLRQLIRLSPDQRIPNAIGWPGLDSLLERTRRTTFAATAAPRAEYRLTGEEPTASVRVLAASRARFRLHVEQERPTRTLIILDSTGLEQDAVLRLRILDGDQRLVPDGVWTLVVTATDSIRSDSIRLRFPLEVRGSVLTLEPMPPPVDSSRLLPEWASPRRGRTILTGIALAGVTVALAAAVRGQEPVSSVSRTDTRAFVAGGGIVLGAAIAAMRDPGKRLPANADQNRLLLEDFRRKVASIQTQNSQARSRFTAVLLVGEVLP